jgi:hypothetical protein
MKARTGREERMGGNRMKAGWTGTGSDCEIGEYQTVNCARRDKWRLKSEHGSEDEK